MGHDLNAALMFVRAAEAGSLRGAARTLGIPKSTVSRRIAALETALGARLLQRTTRRLALTDVGRAYFEQASRALAVLQEAERSIADQEREPAGLLRISASVNLGMLALPPLVNEYLERYPKVQVALELTDRIVDLVHEGYDLALRAGELTDSTLIAHRLGGSAMRLYASPSYLRAHRRPRTPAELVEHDCLVFTPGQQRKWSFCVDGKTIEMAIRPRLLSNNMIALREAAIAGLGVTRLPSFVVADAVRQRQLVAVLDAFAPAEAALHIVYPSARFVPPRVRAFIDLATRRLRFERK